MRWIVGAMNAWTLLLLAGVFEAVWAIGLKYTDGFTRLMPTVVTLVAMVASMIMLAYAVRDLPVGTAYPIWVGIGAVGTAVFGIAVLGEPATMLRLFFLAMLIGSILGLKWTGVH